MAEPPTQEVSKDVAVPPKKRSLFRKQIVPQPVDEDEEVEGVAFFSRAKDLYPMRLAEEERRRQKKLEKVQRKRSSTSAERKTPNTPEVKRRRVSSQVDEQSTDGSPGGDDDKDDDGKHDGLGGTRRASTHSTPGSRRSGSAHMKSPQPATSLSERYNKDLIAKKKELSKAIPAQQAVISLSSDSEEEHNDTALVVKTPAKRVVSIVDDGDDFFHQFGVGSNTSYKPIQDPEEDDDPMFEEAFPELLEKARQREEQRKMERLDAEKAFSERNHLSGERSISIDDDIFQVSNVTDMDPVVDILVTSYIRDTKPMIFRRKISQNLKPVRQGWCDKQIDGPDEAKNLIFLTWRNTKLYDVTTCTMLGLKADIHGNLYNDDDSLDGKGRLHLEAWTEYLFMEYQKSLQKPVEEEELEQEQEQEDESTKIKLYLKAKEKEAIKTKGKPSTTIQKLISVVRGAHDIPDEQEVVLYFDGDALDPNWTIADTELGDKDIIDIRVR